jgi:hypothetical protein
MFPPLGYQQITDVSAAVGLTLVGVAANGVRALITATDQDVRWRDDGVNPTALVGMPLAAGSTLPYEGSLSAIRFIESAAGAKLNVTIYGPRSGDF